MADTLFDALEDGYRDELRRRGWKRIPAGVTAYGGYAVDHYECPETHRLVPEADAFARVRTWRAGVEERGGGTGDDGPTGAGGA